MPHAGFGAHAATLIPIFQCASRAGRIAGIVTALAVAHEPVHTHHQLLLLGYAVYRLGCDLIWDVIPWLLWLRLGASIPFISLFGYFSSQFFYRFCCRSATIFLFPGAALPGFIPSLLLCCWLFS